MPPPVNPYSMGGSDASGSYPSSVPSMHAPPSYSPESSFSASVSFSSSPGMGAGVGFSGMGPPSGMGSPMMAGPGFSGMGSPMMGGVGMGGPPPGMGSPMMGFASESSLRSALMAKLASVPTDTLGAGNPFATGNRICLKSMASGKQLRIKRNGMVDGNGQFGEFAQFEVLRTAIDRCKLRNVANPSAYLRINERGELDGAGTGGRWTEFTIVNHGGHVYSFQSTAHGQYHIGILPTGEVKSPMATGTGQHGRFQVQTVDQWLMGAAGSSAFSPGFSTSMPYAPGSPVITATSFSSDPFVNGNRICLSSMATGKQLRIKANGTVDGLGGFGRWAQFDVVSRGSGRVALRNVGDSSHWLRINPAGVLDGSGNGGPWTEFRVISQGGQRYSLRSHRHGGSSSSYHVGILASGMPKPASNTGTGVNGTFVVKSLSDWTSGI